MGFNDVMYSTLSNALVWRYKVGRYMTYVVPSHVNFIYRVDASDGKVIDDYGLRNDINDSQFYLIGTWCRQTGSYRRYFLSGTILCRDIGQVPWTSMTGRELANRLNDLYPDSAGIDTGILAIMIDDIDVTQSYMDMRNTLTIPNNITAAAFVLIHKYFSQPHPLPYYANFHTFAIDLMEKYHGTNEFDVDTETLTSAIPPTFQDKHWDGLGTKVIIVDYDINEHERVGNVPLILSA